MDRLAALTAVIGVAWLSATLGLAAQAVVKGGNPQAALLKNPVKPTP